jgi:ubiquinone/menaquinone biosynthesis C-methylase UbiE
MPTRQAIIDYYTWKQLEYVGKYSLYGRTHTHVGYHDPEIEPNLFRPGWIRRDLGLDRLRALMHSGQERSVHALIRKARLWSNGNRILDCGAGLGGAALLLAENYGYAVSTLSVVPGQCKYISDQASTPELRERITILLGDAHKLDWWQGVKYDIVVGMDAFCQIGQLDLLFRNFAHIQEVGGVVAITDHFPKDPTGEIASYFNDYWVSSVSSLVQCLTSLENAGYRLRQVRDITSYQLPYWNLSIAYSALPSPDRNDSRRTETTSFHRAMLQAYATGQMRYCQIVATRD